VRVEHAEVPTSGSRPARMADEAVLEDLLEQHVRYA